MKHLVSLLIFALSISFAFSQGTTPTTRYNTVADMVAATVQATASNTRLSALVTGRVTANDGGGGVFFFTPASVTATNAGTVFPSTGVAGRWFRQYSGPVFPEWFGATIGNVAPYDTAAVQACFDWAEGSDNRPIKFGRNYYVTTINIESSFQDVNFNGHKLIGISTTVSTDSVLQIQSYASILRDVHVDMNWNTNYRCATRWFGDAQHTNPGHNEINGLFIENALVGLVIGSHLGDATYNAPLSESYVKGFKTRGTERPVFARQPNGKVVFLAPVFAVTKNEWDTSNPGVFNYTNSYCFYNDPNGGAEFSILGGTFLNSESGTGEGRGIIGNNFNIVDAIWEVKPSNLILGDRVTIRGNRNTGGGFAVAHPAFLIGTNAAPGVLLLDGIQWFQPSGQAAASGTLFVDSSASTNFVVKLVNSQITEYRWSYANELNPFIKGCKAYVQNTEWITLNPVVNQHIDMSSGSVFTTADWLGSSISAVLGTSTRGNWVWAGGGGGFLSSTDAPESYTSSIEVRATAGVASYIVSPQGLQGFPVSPGSVVVIDAWAKGTVRGAIILDWWKPDGTASATTETSLYDVAGVAAQTGWHRVFNRASVPIDAAYASLRLYTEDSGIYKFAVLRISGSTGGQSGAFRPLTEGSVVYAGPSGIYSQNNSAFFWSDASQALAIGHNSPTLGMLHVQASASGALRPRIGLGDTAGAGRWLIQPWSVAGDANLQFVRSAGAGNVIFGMGNENLGVGTTAPTDGQIHMKASVNGGGRPRIGLQDTDGAGSWLLQPWITAGDGNFKIVRNSGSGYASVGADFVLTDAGNGFRIKEGSNARMGVSTLVNGTLTIANTSITTSTRIFVTRQALNGSTTVGFLEAGTKIASTSFVINAYNNLGVIAADDDSIVAWMLVEPSP